MSKKAPNDPSQILLFADLVPNACGGFAVVPRKPSQEISSREAARMLNVARSTLSDIINTEKGQKHLRWRWTTAKKGKRVFELASVLEYREASGDSEFGGERPPRKKEAGAEIPSRLIGPSEVS